jgi:6,7-dimethyl-8-ribityllumazine synthase
MMQVLNKQDMPSRFTVAIVVSRYHSDITQKLLQGALSRLEELQFDSEQITTVWVPGAVEIPITAQRLARSEKYDVIICLGAVIYGETRHFDYVCQQVSQGCQQVALMHDIPVIFGVLTTDNLQQAHDRVGGSKGHMGRDCVDTAYDLISVLCQI